jgi:hypothetical protein
MFEMERMRENARWRDGEGEREREREQRCETNQEESKKRENVI